MYNEYWQLTPLQESQVLKKSKHPICLKRKTDTKSVTAKKYDFFDDNFFNILCFNNNIKAEFEKVALFFEEHKFSREWEEFPERERKGKTVWAPVLGM